VGIEYLEVYYEAWQTRVDDVTINHINPDAANLYARDQKIQRVSSGLLPSAQRHVRKYNIQTSLQMSKLVANWEVTRQLGIGGVPAPKTRDVQTKSAKASRLKSEQEFNNKKAGATKSKAAAGARVWGQEVGDEDRAQPVRTRRGAQQQPRLAGPQRGHQRLYPVRLRHLAARGPRMHGKQCAMLVQPDEGRAAMARAWRRLSRGAGAKIWGPRHAVAARCPVPARLFKDERRECVFYEDYDRGPAGGANMARGTTRVANNSFLEPRVCNDGHGWQSSFSTGPCATVQPLGLPPDESRLSCWVAGSIDPGGPVAVFRPQGRVPSFPVAQGHTGDVSGASRSPGVACRSGFSSLFPCHLGGA
jgi:hypothetical protein